MIFVSTIVHSLITIYNIKSFKYPLFNSKLNSLKQVFHEDELNKLWNPQKSAKASF